MKKLTSLLIAVMLLLSPFHTLQAQEIFDAIRNGDMAKVKELVEKDPQLVKARNARQSTPLHVAVDAEQQFIAEYLLEKGAEVNAVNNNGFTSLFYAKKVNLARLLVEKGADIQKGNPLAWALATKRKEVAEYLLDNGARLPDVQSPQGILFLVRALRCGSGKVLERYMQQGFDPLYESLAKNNLLHYAAESDATDLIEQLTVLGVAADKANMFGWRPLHVAAANGSLQAVQILLKKGAAINARTPDGRTPFNLAMEAKKVETAEFLKSRGADQSPQTFPQLRGEYLGQPKPGKLAVPFAPGILDPMHGYHGAIALTPDGNEMYWSAYVDDSGASILRSQRTNGKWQMPEIFSKGDVPFISPDGKKFYFVASKQVQGGRKEVICVRDRAASGWTEAKELPATINSMPRIHWQVSVDRQGNLYFGASGEKGSRIYCSELKGGEYAEPKIFESLKDVEAFSPYIAPDGTYLIVTNPEAGENLYILFKRRDGAWTNGVELADHIGIEGAFCPIVTPDGRYLFFVCGVDGKYAHFWVDASFIEELRPKE